MILAESDKAMSDEDKIEFAVVKDLCLSQPFFYRDRAVPAPGSDYDEGDEIKYASSA